MDNVSIFPNIARIKDEAGEWLVRLDRGELDTRESQQLQEWLARSQFHQDYLHKLAANWDSMVVLSELAELFPLPDAETKYDHRNPGIFSWLQYGLRLPLITGAVVATGFLLFFTFFNTTEEIPHTPAFEDNYYTAIGEQRSFRLQDGSTIALNTNSRVKVSFSENQRTVRLQQGEVNFQVARNLQKPFVVYVGSGMVWAVGTTFNVRLNSDIVNVTVTEGTVKIYTDTSATESAPVLATNNVPPDNNKVILIDAGQTVQYDEVIRTVNPVSSEELARKLAWHQGALIFNGESLEEAIQEMARYTEQQIVIVDPSIRQTRVGGHFKIGDIDTLLATLSDSFNIKSEQVTPKLIHLSAK